VRRSGVFGLAVLGLTGACASPAKGPRVVFLGDSLTSGYRLPAAEAYPALVERWLLARGRPIQAINAGVNGNTAAEGLARLPGLLATRPSVVVVALGINDGLRGTPPAETEARLREIIERTRDAGAAVVLVGMRIDADSFGAEHALRFGDLYPRLAAEYRLAFVPDLLARVRAEPRLQLRGGLHPNAEGQRRLAETVGPVLELALVERERARRPRVPSHLG
jgi:acyl-CoA thioesterase-1